MKPVGGFSLLVIPVVVMAAMVAAPVVFAETIRLRADNWFPVNGDPAAARPGYGIEVLSRVWSRYTLDYRLMPWARSLDAVRAGDADCVIGAFPGDAPDLLYPQQPLGTDGVGVYALQADSWTYDGVESLQWRNVAVISEYSYGDVLDQWLADPRNAIRIQMAHGAEALEGNIRKLLAGRVDVLLESPMIMKNALRRLNLDHLVQLAGEGQAAQPFYIACTPGNPRVAEWLEAFDQGVQGLKDSGEWGELLSRYGIEEQ
ncbi:MAG: hypothetical protein CVV10_03945 [Gammaproteobacteria bacterium HGW-Gammaproteobacteria-14]|nr:MAG: hypothetical protein CVV10_03945 [Gammaproteobacteria bacterium HGW-Gammaproteobacteria-14]